jgi:hypothetical protein
MVYRREIPNPIYSQEAAEVCLFVKDHDGTGHKEAKARVRSIENSGVQKVIGLTKLKANYFTFEQKRKLCDSYELFLADDRILPSLPKLLGKSFFKKKKCVARSSPCRLALAIALSLSLAALSLVFGVVCEALPRREALLSLGSPPLHTRPSRRTPAITCAYTQLGFHMPSGLREMQAVRLDKRWARFGRSQATGAGESSAKRLGGANTEGDQCHVRDSPPYRPSSELVCRDSERGRRGGEALRVRMDKDWRE